MFEAFLRASIQPSSGQSLLLYCLNRRTLGVGANSIGQFCAIEGPPDETY
jgi:hypothetical protein